MGRGTERRRLRCHLENSTAGACCLLVDVGCSMDDGDDDDDGKDKGDPLALVIVVIVIQHRLCHCHRRHRQTEPRHLVLFSLSGSMF